MPELPMFPLGSVLLPSMLLPLHIFEPRYRVLAHDVLLGEREFGVGMIERGSEVGGDEVRTNLAVVAQVLESEQFDDGRWGLVCVGTRRIRVLEWLDDDPYPRAIVEDWPEDPTPDDQTETVSLRFDELRGKLRKLLVAMAEFSGEAAPPLSDITDDPALGSYQVAVLAPIGTLDRYRVLEAPDAAHRITLLHELLDDQELFLQARFEDR